MNTRDIVKTLAEKGFNISEEEVQLKIDAFSKTFRLPPEEAGRAALNHFISANKLSVPVRTKPQAPVPAGQIQTPAAAPAPIHTAAPPSLQNAGINDKILKLIIDVSQRVSCRLANYTDIIKEAAAMGIAQKQVEDAVSTLIAEGKCIEPLIGKLYPVSQK